MVLSEDDYISNHKVLPTILSYVQYDDLMNCLLVNKKFNECVNRNWSLMKRQPLKLWITDANEECYINLGTKMTVKDLYKSDVVLRISEKDGTMLLRAYINCKSCNFLVRMISNKFKLCSPNWYELKIFKKADPNDAAKAFFKFLYARIDILTFSTMRSTNLNTSLVVKMFDYLSDYYGHSSGRTDVYLNINPVPISIIPKISNLFGDPPVFKMLAENRTHYDDTIASIRSGLEMYNFHIMFYELRLNDLQTILENWREAKCTIRYLVLEKQHKLNNVEITEASYIRKSDNAKLNVTVNMNEHGALRIVLLAP